MESTKTSIFSQIKHEIQCPLCGKIFSESTSFIELNFHLYFCGNEKLVRNKTNMCLNNIIQKESQEIIHQKCKSETKRKKNINKDESNIIKNTNNDLQLVIDYNEEEEDIYEEQLKKGINNNDANEKFVELRNFITSKKEQMNFLLTIECNSLSQMFKALKEINIYYNIKFIYEKKNNEIKHYSLNYVINKYIKTMIKINRF